MKLTPRLQERLGKKSPIACMSCGAQFVYRLNRESNTVFLGCGRYPECKATIEIPEDLKAEILGYQRLPGF